MSDLAQKIAELDRRTMAGEIHAGQAYGQLKDAIRTALPVAQGEAVALDCYDAGLLSDFGGGDVNWWQDYIRAELNRAHEFYQSQVDNAAPAIPAPEAQGEAECYGCSVGMRLCDDGLHRNPYGAVFPHTGTVVSAPPASRIAELEREMERLREALVELRDASCGDMGRIECRHGFRMALIKTDKALAAQEKK